MTNDTSFGTCTWSCLLRAKAIAPSAESIHTPIEPAKRACWGKTPLQCRYLGDHLLLLLFFH